MFVYFFTKYVKVTDYYESQSTDIWKSDETGVITVPKLRSIKSIKVTDHVEAVTSDQCD